MEIKELLKKRRLLKKKKPEFTRQDCHKKKKVGWKWRKPRGSDSKMRVSRKGYKRSVRVGWGSPLAVKGMNRDGLVPMTVNNVTDLAKVDPKKDVVVIGSSVGTKKKMEIIEQALSKSLVVSNYADPKKFLEDMKADFEKKKKEKTEKKVSRDKKKEDVKKEAEKAKKKEEKEKAEKKDDSEEMTEEEKKIEDKKDKDKLLISTQ